MPQFACIEPRPRIFRANAAPRKNRRRRIPMSTASQFSAPYASDTASRSLREVWLFLVVMGAALIVVGMLAIGASFIATLATVVVFGILLLAGAILQVFAAIWGRRWR